MLKVLAFECVVPKKKVDIFCYTGTYSVVRKKEFQFYSEGNKGWWVKERT